MQLREHSCRKSLIRFEAVIWKFLLSLLISLSTGVSGYTAPTLVTNFTGIAQTSYTPPDPVIAVGPSNIVAMVNSSFTIYDKAGNSLYSSTLANWFAPVNPPGTPFQPKIVYDANGGHWIMLALASGNPKRSSYLISVSSNSTPIGVWFVWNSDAGLDQNTVSGNTADSPGLGYDDDAIYITSNQYDSHDAFQYAKLRIIPKSILYSGSTLTWRDFWNQTNANGATVFGWKPAQAQSTLHGNYLIDTRPNGSNYVTLWKVTNPLSTNPGPTLTRQATLAVLPYAAPNDAMQLGGVAMINTGDCRAQEVQFQNGKLVTAFTEGYNWGSGAVSAVRTLVLDPSGNSVSVDNRFGLDMFWYYYPAIVRDVSGNMGMVFNRSSSNEYVGSRYTVWLSGDTNWQASAVLRAGQAYYGTGVNLWGSYSGAALDPANPAYAWIYSDHAVSSNQWGTWIGAIPFAANTNTNPNANDQCAGAIALTNGASYSVNTSSASSTNDPTTVCGLAVDKGVWFSFTPNATGPLLISTCGSDFATVLQVYSGACESLSMVACNAGSGPTCSSAQASLQFDGVAGTTYRIFVGGAGGASGNLAIEAFSLGNDVCAGALPLPPGSSYLLDTSTAGSDGDPPQVCGFTVGKGLWFSFIAPGDGRATITTCGSSFQTVLQVYSGSCSSLVDIDCSSSSFDCLDSRASIQFQADAGTNYLIFAAGLSGASGNLFVSNYFCQPPKIVGGFTNSLLTSTGILVSATVVLEGTPPFSVNWACGPFFTNTGANQSVSFLIPLDQIPDFMTETNFSTINVSGVNDCGSDGGNGGFSSPCVVCLSRGVPVTSSTTANISGTGPNLPSDCGNLGFAAKWFDMAAADFGAADVSVFQDKETNCFVSVFAGNLPALSPVTCNRTITNRQTRLQFQATPTQHYYLVITNSATVTNMTFGFVPQLSGSISNGAFQLKTGVGPALPYTFQASTEVLGVWTNLHSAIFPTNGLTYIDVAATNFDRRFYRVAPVP